MGKFPAESEKSGCFGEKHPLMIEDNEINPISARY